MKNILLALRTIKSYRIYSIVNIVGLMLSLACVVTICRYIYTELTVDQCHSKIDQIYAVTSTSTHGGRPRLSGTDNPNNVKGYVDISSDAQVILKSTVIYNEKKSN